MNSQPNPRKQRRRAENDAYSSTARFWGGQKTIWSNATTVYRPVNKNAVKLINPPKNHAQSKTRKKHRDVNVYLFRVRTKGSDEIFLKIGITNSLAHRFDEDEIRYRFDLLCSIGQLTRREAITVEKRLHSLFSDWAYNPRNGFVTGGHTECFVDYEPIVDTTRTLFGLLEEEKLSLRERLIELQNSAPQKTQGAPTIIARP